MPTFAQAGLPLPETDFGAWTALLVPKSTPREAIQQLNQAVNTALNMPELRAQLSGMGVTVEPGNPEAAQTLVTSQIQAWTQLIQQAGIKAE